MGAVSEAAKQHRKKTALERYYWYKDAGICPRCRNWADNGRTLCKECRDKNRRYEKLKDPTNAKKNQYAKERRARLKAQGLCIDCAKRPAEAGKTRCSKCMVSAQDSRIKYNIHQRTIKMQSGIIAPEIGTEGRHFNKGVGK